MVSQITAIFLSLLTCHNSLVNGQEPYDGPRPDPNDLSYIGDGEGGIVKLPLQQCYFRIERTYGCQERGGERAIRIGHPDLPQDLRCHKEGELCTTSTNLNRVNIPHRNPIYYIPTNKRPRYEEDHTLPPLDGTEPFPYDFSSDLYNRGFKRSFSKIISPKQSHEEIDKAISSVMSWFQYSEPTKPCRRPVINKFGVMTGCRDRKSKEKELSYWEEWRERRFEIMHAMKPLQICSNCSIENLNFWRSYAQGIGGSGRTPEGHRGYILDDVIAAAYSNPYPSQAQIAAGNW